MDGFAGNSCRFYVSSTGGLLEPFIDSARNIAKSFFHLMFHRNNKHRFTLITTVKILYLASIIILYARISYPNSSYCLEYGVKKWPYIYNCGRCESHISSVVAVLQNRLLSGIVLWYEYGSIKSTQSWIWIRLGWWWGVESTSFVQNSIPSWRYFTNLIINFMLTLWGKSTGQDTGAHNSMVINWFNSREQKE